VTAVSLRFSWFRQQLVMREGMNDNFCPMGPSDDVQEPLDSNRIPIDKSGKPIAEYRIFCPMKSSILGPQGIFHQLRKDFTNFLHEQVVRVCSEPAKGTDGQSMSEGLFYNAFIDIWGRRKRVFLNFDFCRSRIEVIGLQFRVLKFRKPRKWVLFGSMNCEEWETIHRYTSFFPPSTNKFVTCSFPKSRPWRYLQIKFYRSDILIEKLDFFGYLSPE
jgi:hypothetical protein